MIYFILLGLTFLGVYHFDFVGKKENRDIFFFYILMLCISISAFKFRIGTDILAYMEEYKTYPALNHLQASDLTANPNRLPGWVFLISFLRYFSTEFVLFQIVQAVFINSIIFQFIKNNTKYIFTAILFYLVFMYTELNFEVMRESFAVGFFILSINSFKEKRWLKYYVYVAMAFTFHLSAFFLIFLPFVNFLKITQRTLYAIYILFIVLLLCLPMLSGKVTEIAFLGIIGDKATSYLQNERYQVEISPIFILKSVFLFIVFYYLLVIYNAKHQLVDRYTLYFVILYLLLDILNRGVPIFYRFNNYLQIFYVLAITQFISSYPKNDFFKRCSFVVYMGLLLLFCYFPIRTYFVVDGFLRQPAYIKYYPYYSVFNPQYDQDREEAFNN